MCGLKAVIRKELVEEGLSFPLLFLQEENSS